MIFSSSDVLTPQQLKRLSEHRYSCSGSSFVDPFMQPFWNWVTTKCPLWLAPNLMTITGLAVNIATSLLLVCYSPTATQEVPRWAFLLCALGLFVYQTLDACDGKQARRTGTSSPLGELFDHGCDSISTVFVALAVCIAVKLGYYPCCMLQVSVTLANVLSGIPRRFDVTEAQFSVMIIHLVSAIFGPGVWATRMPPLGLPLKFLPLILGVSAAAVALCSYVGIIFTGGVGKNGSSVAGTSVLSPSIPIALVVVPAFIIYQKSTTSIYENHPCLYIIAFGMVAAKVTNRLVVAHMCRSEMDYMDSILIGPGMLFLNQYFNTFINEYVILWICLVYSAADLLHYCTIVCNQICGHLQIPLLRIAPKFPPSLVDRSPPNPSPDVRRPTSLLQPHRLRS
ncbi:sn-1,2-diacylglycerol ethanolamine- and cholinephosphotranferase, putative [Ixodes scapularis]|uniref:diacylglycerol cholinephosphotransferase n=1 Tax=Ixodes scapularis TaxID=6945 RepID=B7PMX3_IXOSC|nr:sn-1,2-diacylglycerol ethanolamine- and cholinephosphotranferase, putative [Ixodes scapularis]|eukprot:XP_002435121.1 sn-1,2-diacylglycerol ethanolamine- and cholinephosphotranferase, putative [Ixodes scapularis]